MGLVEYTGPDLLVPVLALDTGGVIIKCVEWITDKLITAILGAVGGGFVGERTCGVHAVNMGKRKREAPRKDWGIPIK